MYKLPNVDLLPADLDGLNVLQNGVDACAGYAAQVAAAKVAFGNKPVALFRRLRDGLREMSGELVRCAYCEDSCADEVEHIRPKDFYPGETFKWSNYLFSCGPCNGGKRNNYVLMVGDSKVDLVDHRKHNGVVLPPVGSHLFVDPRAEEPMNILWLDLIAETSTLSAFDEDDEMIEARAQATITILNLNRESLRKARANAYTGYRDRLAQLVGRVKEGAPEGEISSRKADISRSPHRTVWLEMKRQRNQLPKLNDLFSQIPDTLLL